MSVQTIKKADSSSFATKAFFVTLLWSLLGLLQANAQAHIDQVALDNHKFLTVRDLVVVDCESSIEGPLALPSDIIAIGTKAFEGCYSLTSLTLPASLQQVGEGAFRHCYSLETIQVQDGNKFFRSSDGILFSYDFQKIVRYPPALLLPSLKFATLPLSLVITLFQHGANQTRSMSQIVSSISDGLILRFATT